MRQLCKTLAFLLLMAFYGDHLRADSSVQPSSATQTIDALVKQIQSDKPLSQERDKHAQMLFRSVSHMEVSVITDQEIDLISSLLQDNNDVVRFNAARALGYIGPKARRAVPALETALKKVKSELADKRIWTGTSSEFEICPALKKITGRIPSPECKPSDLDGE